MFNKSLPAFFFGLLFFGLLPATLLGQVTWVGGGGNSSWSTAENWSAVPVDGNALVFDGSNLTSNVNDELTSIGNLTFASTASAFTLSGNAITLGGNILNSSTSSVQTINLDMATSAVRTITLSGIYSTTVPSTSGVTLGGDISGTGGINVADGTLGFGSGTVTVLGNNSFEGGFTFRGNDSTRKLLNLGHANALGTGLFTWSANNNSNTLNTLDNISGSTMTIANNLLLAGSRGRMTFVGTNDFIFAGTVTNSQDTNTAGRLIEVNAGNVTFQGNIFLSDLVGTGRGLTFGGAGSSTVTGIISNYNGVGGTAGKVTVGGTSKLVGTTTLELLNPSNTYTGSTSMGATDASSTLVVTKLSDGGEASSIGASSNDAANLVVNGVRADATLRYIGSGDSTDRLFTISSDGSVLKIESSGTGALHFTNTGDIVVPGTTGSVRTVELGGTYTGGVNTMSSNVTGARAGLRKEGAGTWNLTNTNGYAQTTTVNAGTLLVSGTGSINSTSAITVNNSGSKFHYTSSTGLDRNVTLLTGGAFFHSGETNYSGTTFTWTNGVLGGTNWNGAKLDNLTVNANRTISPGDSPGIASTVNQTWGIGGGYIWEINDVDAGAGSGWDLLSLTDSLSITATSGDRFTIYVTSLTTGNTPGAVADFSKFTSYQWKIADAVNTISTFDVDKFEINTTDFSNDFAGGSFSIARGDTAVLGGSDTDLYLVYTAIPEPNTAMLLGMGLATLLLRRRWAK